MSVENAWALMQMQKTEELFREFSFEPGTGFTCDLVKYPATQHDVPNYALRAYSSTYDNLTEHQRMLIAEQIGRLIQSIRSLGVNCILEVHDAPGKSGSKGRNG
ncbi:hypothetical protein KNV00_gp081 [Streptomyces phage Bmoc]|uniref:Uncharacterized protein n=4 Tax=Samistivirus TaxID=2560220 RepID=A0A6M3T0M0_9CAUD|nr:hypothetical protein AXJ18_gp090 [Streptomyces phage Jay2Jay]YP_010103558.1 hypothetical protein KNU67_gp083 [Streptomyces phage Evy]YP_010107589.1 hypothetical protein KNV00_gp081 [Streptomyces phage Bmoc]ASN73258.1 hypothetical protein SEA_WARPY_227 [Streptomyces phage Warpy]UEM46970.1 hypothetical protein SEA_TARGARYEN_224 [Streptomyces phage Targaryen]AIW02684.1 hypothetical protein PBI_JAY2JAY_230 [Streptomyces phage Jay2Jay]QDH94049.1 hypothetical protein SEA_EVY_214 [Streptomyces ph